MLAHEMHRRVLIVDDDLDIRNLLCGFLQRNGYAATAVADGKTMQTALKGAWTPHMLERFAADDVTLWLNLKAILGDPTISGMLQMLAPMAGPAFNVEQLKAFETFTISLRLEKTGLHMGLYQGVDKNSPQGKAISSGKPTCPRAVCLLSSRNVDTMIRATGELTHASRESLPISVPSLRIRAVCDMRVAHIGE